jgi:LPS-assembly lipoprotein
MWSSSAQRPGLRTLALLAALAAPLALAGCSGFTPVYGPQSLTSQQIEIAYASPTNRYEQVIYDDLRLRLGKAGGPDSPKLSVSATAFSADLTSKVVTTAQTPRVATVVADITLTAPDGSVLFRGKRSQTADYSTGPQIVSNNQASSDARERAAHLLADTIRLTVLGALSR